MERETAKQESRTPLESAIYTFSSRLSCLCVPREQRPVHEQEGVLFLRRQKKSNQRLASGSTKVQSSRVYRAEPRQGPEADFLLIKCFPPKSSLLPRQQSTCVVYTSVCLSCGHRCQLRNLAFAKQGAPWEPSSTLSEPGWVGFILC